MADGLVLPQMPPDYAASYINSWLAGVGVREREKQLELMQERYRAEDLRHEADMRMRQQSYELNKRNIDSLIGERDARAKLLKEANDDTELFNQYLAGWDPTESDAEQTLAQGLADFPGALNTVGGRLVAKTQYHRLNAARATAKNNFNTKRLAFQNYFDNAYGGAQETGILDDDTEAEGGAKIGKWWEERVSKTDPSKSFGPYKTGTTEKDPYYWDPNAYKTTGNMWTQVTGIDPKTGQPATQFRTRNRKQLLEDIRMKKELGRERAALLDQVDVPALGVYRNQGLSTGSDLRQQAIADLQEAGQNVTEPNIRVRMQQLQTSYGQ